MRLLKHIRQSVVLLRAAGAEDINIDCSKHFHVDFIFNGRRETFTMSCSPRRPEKVPAYTAAAIRKLKLRKD